MRFRRRGPARRSPYTSFSLGKTHGYPRPVADRRVHLVVSQRVRTAGAITLMLEEAAAQWEALERMSEGQTLLVEVGRCVFRAHRGPDAKVSLELLSQGGADYFVRAVTFPLECRLVEAAA